MVMAAACRNKRSTGQGALYREENLAPKRLLQTVSLNLLLIVSLAFTFFSVQAKGLFTTDSNFNNFVASVEDGQAGILRGVYVNGVISLLVVQQPFANPSYVSTSQGVVTEFQSARAEGNIGLLAHNYLAGKDFPLLTLGQEVRAVYGDGQVEYFKITKILHFKTLQPTSITSNFINLDSGELLTASQVFGLVYKGPRHVTFQTCIDRDGNSSWGRLFIIAEPVYHILNSF